MLSGQQYQFCSGQHPAGHIVPSHCFLAANLTRVSLAATKGQSAAVAAQYMLSGQQYQFCSGQHPAGHIVPSHCFLAAIFINLSLAATKGQSAAAAAQYMLSGQQYQSTSGQPPSWQQKDSQQRWQHSTCYRGSSTSQTLGNIQLGTWFPHIASWQPSSST